jgi:hypothetical protein
MKLVDKGLKEIFKRKEITTFIKAYGYLINTGCYNKVEAISNALYYFPDNNINDYDLIMYRNIDGSKKDVTFYKLIDGEHLKSYIDSIIKDADGDIYDELVKIYTEDTIIDGITNREFNFICKDYNGALFDNTSIDDDDDDDIILEDEEILDLNGLNFTRGQDNNLNNLDLERFIDENRSRQREEERREQMRRREEERIRDLRGQINNPIDSIMRRISNISGIPTHTISHMDLETFNRYREYYSV